MIQHFFTSFGLLALVAALFDGSVSSVPNTTSDNISTLTSLERSPSLIYPPPGLLDSLSSMKFREDIYQSNLSKQVARAEIDQELPWLAQPQGLLPSLRIDSIYRSLFFPSTTSTPSSTILTIQSPTPTPRPTVFVGPAGVITPPTSSFAPPLHVFISLTWTLVITFIVLSILTTIFGSLGNAFIVIMLINIICALHLQSFQADAHPDPHPHHPHFARHPAPLRRPIGGLRPGPVGKIPCGPVRGTIGSKDGKFPQGVHRKIGGLKPALEDGGELFCDDWGNANFGRGLAANATVVEEDAAQTKVMERGMIAIPTPPSDDTEDTTTILSTLTSTLWVTVPDQTVTATTYRLTDSASSLPTPVSTEDEIPYSTAAETAASDSSDSLADRSPFETPYYGQAGSPVKESSAVPPAVNIRTSFTYLLLLYLAGMLVCLLLGGSSYALSFLLISFALAAIIAGAEAAAVQEPGYGHYDYGGRLGASKPVKTIGSVDTKKMNTTVAKGGNLQNGLENPCGELFCHNWSNINTSLVTKQLTPTYSELVKRQSTLYITVPPTSGVIQIEGPQIIPITVVSTAFAEVVGATVTVDAVTERSTRTVNVEVEQSTGGQVSTIRTTRYVSAGTGTTTLSNRMSELGTGRTRTVASGETTITVNAVLPSSTSVSVSLPPPTTETETVFRTVTYTPPVSSSSSSSTSASYAAISTADVPEPTTSASTSQASHLDPTKLYLSFVETNLYCFLFLFIGLNIALRTSHPLAYVGSMAALAMGGAAVLQMCAGGSGVLRCKGAVT